MAQPIAAATTKSKDHRRRKNQGAAEVFRKQRKARNEARPKQRWDEQRGLWTREPIGGVEA